MHNILIDMAAGYFDVLIDVKDSDKVKSNHSGSKELLRDNNKKSKEGRWICKKTNCQILHSAFLY